MKIVVIMLLTLSLLLSEEISFDDSTIVEDQNKGKVTYVDGVVKKKFMSAESYDEDVQVDGEVNSRESYKTMIKSRAELELKGMDIIRLAPKTTIDLISLYEELLDGESEKTQIKLEEGDIWAQVNSSDDDSEFELESGIASAAITGTNFRLSKNMDGGTTMKVYHGEVKISNSKNPEKVKPKKVDEFRSQSLAPKAVSGPKQISGPKEVSLKEWVYIVKNMEKITFDKNGNVTSAGEFSKTDPDENSSWVNWNRKRDRAKGLR